MQNVRDDLNLDVNDFSDIPSPTDHNYWSPVDNDPNLMDRADIDPDDIDVNDVLPSNQIFDEPLHLQSLSDSISQNIEAEQTSTLNSFNHFLEQKYDELNTKAQEFNPDAPPINRESKFDKNIQTQWFSEYNQDRNDNNRPFESVLCKKNGFFYTERDLESEDPINDALINLGVPALDANKLKNNFEFSFLGNTSTKKDPNKSLKTFVLRLREPYNNEKIDAFNQVQDHKKNLVNQYIQKHYSLDQAITKFTSRLPVMIQEDKDKNNGKEPFIGRDQAIFFNRKAAYDLLSDIPEIKGKFKIEPLDASHNKLTYSGLSNSLDSYFDAEMSVYKLVTKDESVLNQDTLEKLAFNYLEDKNQPIVSIQALNNNQIVEKQLDLKNQNESKLGVLPKINQKPNLDEALPNIISEKAQLKSDDISSENDKFERKRYSKNKGSEKDNEKETTTLGEVASNAAQKALEKLLEIILRLAQLLLIAILALLRVGAAFVNNRLTNSLGVTPHFKYPTTSELFNQTNFVNKLLKRSDPSKSNEQNAALDIKKALDADSSLNPNNDKKEELNLDAKGYTNEKDRTINIGSLITDELKSNLKPEDKIRLDEEIQDEILTLTPAQKLEILNDSLDLPTKHKIDENLTQKLSEKMLIDPEHGILLSKNDLVELKDGVQAGVLTAFKAGDALIYAVANEAADKNYALEYVEADKLKLIKHNAVEFDNFENLVEQAKQHVESNMLNENVQFINLHDHNNPSSESVTIQQVLEDIQVINSTKLEDLKDIDVLKRFDESDFKKRYGDSAIPQLHEDSTSSIVFNRDHGQTHPLFGKLLDVNDLVTAKTGDNNISIEGSIYLAYSHNNDLYYQIKTTDGLDYHIPAKKIDLKEINGGFLTQSDLDDRFKRSKQHGFKLQDSLSFSGIDAQIIPLSHPQTPEGFDDFYKIKRGLQYTAHTINKEIIPLDSIEKQQVYSLKNANGVSHYAVLGHIDKDGFKQPVAIEIGRSALSTISPNFIPTINPYQAKIIEINSSLGGLKSTEISNPVLQKFISDNVDNHNFAVDKTKSKLLDLFGQELVENLDIDKLKEKLYKHKNLATALLISAASPTAFSQPDVQFGHESNLISTVIKDEALAQIIYSANKGSFNAGDNSDFNPINPLNSPYLANSTAYSDSTPYGNMDGSLQDFIKQNHLNSLTSMNGLSVKSDSLPTLKAGLESLHTIAVDMENVDQTGVMNIPIMDKPIDETIHITTPQEINKFDTSSLVDLANSLPSGSNMTQIARFAAGYVANDGSMFQPSKAYDLLMMKQQLEDNWSKVETNFKQLASTLSKYIDGVSESGVVLAELKLRDKVGLENELESNHYFALAFSNLSENFEDYQLGYEIHLNKISNRFAHIDNQQEASPSTHENNLKVAEVVSELYASINNNIKNVELVCEIAQLGVENKDDYSKNLQYLNESFNDLKIKVDQIFNPKSITPPSQDVQHDKSSRYDRDF